MCYAGAGVMWALALATLFCICCCWNNIMLGAALMQAASEFVTANLRIMITPLLSYCLVLIFFAWWVVSATWLYSMGNVVAPGNPNLSMMAELDPVDDFAYYTMWYYLFGLFWVVAFFLSLQKFIVAAAATLWYFDPIDDGSKDVSICEAMTWGLWYHCGTIAFGSFVIAVVEMIRAIFEYLAKKSDEVGGDNPAKKAIECVIRACLWCVDACVKYITESAYMQCCVSNEGFCFSAWNSFCLLIRHAGRFGSLAMVDWMLNILGKGCICASSAGLAYVVADKAFPLVQQPAIPAIAILCYAYVVGSLFLTIFSFAARTILFCYLVDEDNGGSSDTPKSLKPFVDYVDSDEFKEAELGKKPEGKAQDME